MKKWLLSILMVLAISVMAIPAMVFADAPTTVVVNWVGGGSVTGTSVAGTAATYNFATNGNQIAGWKKS